MNEYSTDYGPLLEAQGIVLDPEITAGTDNAFSQIRIGDVVGTTGNERTVVGFYRAAGGGRIVEVSYDESKEGSPDAFVLTTYSHIPTK